MDIRWSDQELTNGYFASNFVDYANVSNISNNREYVGIVRQENPGRSQVMAVPTLQGSTLNFLDLHLELRREVYHHYLPRRACTPLHIQDPLKRQHPDPIALLLVSKQVSEEALDILRRTESPSHTPWYSRFEVQILHHREEYAAYPESTNYAVRGL